MENIFDAMPSLTQPGTFAILVVLLPSGERVLRPIGGEWGSGIVEAVCEMAEKYPDGKMKLFEENYDAWWRYFEGNIPRERLL